MFLFHGPVFDGPNLVIALKFLVWVLRGEFLQADYKLGDGGQEGIL